ncbi:ATP-dependent RNA helicase [Nymphaea thermarum]|nr:ATP-dependent RNA helicase [Nymphaea thermarum]
MDFLDYKVSPSAVGTVTDSTDEGSHMEAQPTTICDHLFGQGQFLEKAKTSPFYFITNCEDILKVAAVIDEMPLSLEDKYLFCISPVDMNDEISGQGLVQFAESYSKRGVVHLKEIFTPGTLQVPKSQIELMELESIHKVLDLYVWLSFRLEESFPDREVASAQKEMCNLLIEEFLERLGWQRPRARNLFKRPLWRPAFRS